MFKLRRYLRGHYAQCVLAPLFKMLEALLQLLVPLVMAQVIDVGIARRDAAFVLAHGALLVGMGVFAWAISVTAQYFCSKLAAAFGTALRDDLFAHVLSLSRADVERLGRATLVTRVTNDSQQVQDGLNMFFRLILRSPFVTFGTVVAAFLVDGIEGAALLVAVIASFAVVMGFMRVTTRRYRAGSTTCSWPPRRTSRACACCAPSAARRASGRPSPGRPAPSATARSRPATSPAS